MTGSVSVVVSISGPAIGGRTGPGSGAPPRILTGSDGRFAFRDLPLGSVTIVASKGGYSDGASGRRVIGGATQPVALNATQKTADVSILWLHIDGVRRGDLTDVQWRRLEPHLPPEKPWTGRSNVPHRRILNGIL